MSGLLRFLGASRLREPPKPIAIQPHQRLLYFKSSWLSIQRDSTLLDKAKREEKVVPEINTLTRLLLDECTRADRLAPKACLEYALHRDIFFWLVTLAVSGPSELTKTVISAFVELVETQDDNFLTHEAVCKNLATLFKHIGRKTHKRSMLDSTIQLLFAICSKIHHYPPLLAMFFDANVWIDRVGSPVGGDRSAMSEASLPERIEDDFLIFYLLMDNMHQPGHNGDFCRTGLLYLLNASKDDQNVQRWVAESGFAMFLTMEKDLFLASSHDQNLSDDDASMENEVLTSSTNPEFLEAFDKFLTYMAYWQDVLCVVTLPELQNTLLDSFRILFLQSILYPSLMESSDNDGSSVAVSTYLASILDILKEESLVDVSLRYLFASEIKATATSRASRRATLMAGLKLSTMLDPSIFSLKDMIFDNLRSTSNRTKIATVRLLESLIRCHWPYLLDVLITTAPLASTRNPTIGHHLKEMQTLSSLLDQVGKDIPASDSYQTYLHDAQIRIESQTQDIDDLLLLEKKDDPDPSYSENLKENQKPSKRRHTIVPDDKLIKEILNLLASFFTNEVELNLILTQLIVDLASCPQRSLEGWLLFGVADSWIGVAGSIAPDYSITSPDAVDPEDDSFLFLEETTLSDIEDDNSVDFGMEATPRAIKSRILPSWSRFPPVLTLLKTLAAQIRQYKSEIETLSSDVEDRRRALQSCGDKPINAVMEGIWSQSSVPQPPPSVPPPNPRSPVSLFRRMSSRQNTSPPQTPRKEHLESPFAQHFTDTKRKVTTLHSLALQDETDRAHPSQETPTKPRSKSQGTSLLDMHTNKSGADVRDSTDEIGPQTITLSKLINNVIIFEEFVLELMALVQVRRCLCDNCEFV